VSDTLLPILYGLLVWWLSTGVALYVVGMTGEKPRSTLIGATLLFLGSLATLAATRNDPGVGGAYIAFTAAIGVWGAQEIAFLTGWVTGSWRAPCPPGARGFRRMGYAIRAILHHELALAASGVAVFAATWGGANQTGAWTFAVLFAMRISAKLNVFLGVPNLTENFLPAHLAYLKSFFARRPMNLLMPVSVTVSTVAIVLLVQGASAADGAAATSLVFLATLVALGLLEHWFLVLPLPVEALWTWGLASRDARAAALAAAPVTAEAVLPLSAKIVRLEAHSTVRGATAPLSRTTHLRAGTDARLTATRTDHAGGRP
jgi:putative photosynthetic complex assembly protein 2